LAGHSVSAERLLTCTNAAGEAEEGNAIDCVTLAARVKLTTAALTASMCDCLDVK
jgi:hypothetical protein